MFKAVYISFYITPCHIAKGKYISKNVGKKIPSMKLVCLR